VKQDSSIKDKVAKLLERLPADTYRALAENFSHHLSLTMATLVTSDNLLPPLATNQQLKILETTLIL